MTTSSSAAAPLPASEALFHEAVLSSERPEPVPELTPRALAWGVVLGCLLGVSNLYLGLVLGGNVSVGVTAALIAFPVQRLLTRLAPRQFGREFSLLEGCVLQTTASGAGYAIVSSLPSVAVAWMLTQAAPLPRGMLLAWTLCTSLLGLCFGLALQRRFLAREGLVFPASVGAAATLRAVHARQGSQTRALLCSVTGASLVGLSRDFLRWGPGQWVPPVSMLMVGAGALMGLRLAVSMLLGGAVSSFALVPALVAHHVVESAEGAGLQHTAWVGSTLLVSAALVRLLLFGGTLLRSSLRRSEPLAAPPGAPEPQGVPRAWLGWSTGALSVATVAMAWLGLGVSWPLGVLAVGLSMALTLFACRILGETGSPPDVAVNQLACGLLLRAGPVPHLVHSSLAFNSSSVGVDLLANLKTARLLGATLRPQLIAQAVGCILGALVLVPVFTLLVPDASAVSGEHARFPALAGQQVRILADMLGQGLQGLAPIQQWSVLLAAGLGVVLTLAEELLPKERLRWVPSAMGMGVAFFLPFEFSLFACLGGALSWVVTRRRPEAAEQWVLPAACGLISAESLCLAFGTMITTWLG